MAEHDESKTPLPDSIPVVRVDFQTFDEPQIRRTATGAELKCPASGFEVRARHPAIAASLSSSKCDFRMVRTGLGLQLRAQSAKCDVMMDARHAAGHSQIESAKCDYSISARSQATAVSVHSSKCDLLVRTRGTAGRMEMRSSKCDFMLRGVNSSTETRVTSAKSDLALTGHSTRSRISGSSAKCDWRIQAVSVGPAPFVEAEMTAAKCDFSLLVRFGQRGRTVYEAEGVMSAKCEFRLGRLRGPGG
jgi:hypothetical protein